MAGIIRQAALSDAEAITGVLRRSIAELCRADHKGDEELLQQWLANKTPDNVAKWLGSGSTTAWVAELDHRVVGVGMLSRPGEVLLCYVTPEVIGKGMGYQLLQCMLQAANGWGLKRVFLESTATAQNFYLCNGFEPAGEPVMSGRMWGYPMQREVAFG
ncbi:GNAT family N-acetyltransferase [Natronospirillum operosum]|nr:GNAT family N-acetyltransferase [Natronospirillum operosum]